MPTRQCTNSPRTSVLAAGATFCRVLTSPDNVRADVIRQFHERGQEDMVDLLVLLEEQEWNRQAMIEELRAAEG